MPTDYSKEGIIAQALIVFGQGTGPVRVSHQAALRVRSHYEELFDKKGGALLDSWKTDAVQALERVRISGMKAAQEATLKSQTKISEEVALQAMLDVEQESHTNICKTEP